MTSNYVTLSVRKATLIRDNNGDRYYGSVRGDLIEVDMTSTQFAELLTTMNIGMGVPCTVTYVDGKKMESPPDLETEAENIREGFNKSVTAFAEEVKKVLPTVKEIMEKKTLNKADRETVIKAFEKVVNELGSSVPYTLELFQKATEKVVNAAKTEVDAFITGAVTQAGIAALQANPEALLLGGKSE